MVVIGVMGGGSGTRECLDQAYELGRLIAQQGWVLLNGGRDAGVMDISAKGAKDAGGLTVGVLPDADKLQMSSHIDIPILTDMGAARNNINVLSSQVVVACPGGAGTLSEVALAIKSRKPVICMGWDPGEGVKKLASEGMFYLTSTPEQTIGRVKKIL